MYGIRPTGTRSLKSLGIGTQTLEHSEVNVQYLLTEEEFKNIDKSKQIAELTREIKALRAVYQVLSKHCSTCEGCLHSVSFSCPFSKGVLMKRGVPEEYAGICPNRN